jgi:DNA-binding transcriptional LysR family regulator
LTINVETDLPSRKALPPFAALRAFDAVARVGGVRRAAEVLNVDHAVVSRHLRAIEAWTGAALIDRTRTGAILTEEGLRYHVAIADAIDLIADATSNLMKSGSEDRLSTWCMPGLAYHWLMERLEDFERANPGLDIDVRPTDQCPDFNRHEADVDIRFAPAYGEPLRLAACVRTAEIVRPEAILVASPDYYRSIRPMIKSAANLLECQLLHEESFGAWRAWLEAQGVRCQDDLPGPCLWHAHLTLDAARRGRGLALANYLIVADDFAAGRLVEIRGPGSGFKSLSLGAYLFAARADQWAVAPIARYREWLMVAIATDISRLRQRR